LICFEVSRFPVFFVIRPLPRGGAGRSQLTHLAQPIKGSAFLHALERIAGVHRLVLEVTPRLSFHGSDLIVAGLTTISRCF